MYMPRWSVLAPRLQSLHHIIRLKYSAHLKVPPAAEVPPPLLDGPELLLRSLAKIADDLESIPKKRVKEKGKQHLRTTSGESKANQLSKPNESSKSMGHVQGECVSSGTVNNILFTPLQDVTVLRRDHIPKLAHGLERVLSRQGVHWLMDPETGEYNFDEHLQTIPKVAEFAFDKLVGFVPSSQDKRLIEHAQRSKCKYAGSTSSLTGILAQIYLLLSEEKLVNISHLSDSFDDVPKFFTPGQRIPVSVILRHQDGVYTTDVDTEREGNKEDIILLPLGTLLEKFLTLPQETFSRFLKSHSADDHLRLEEVHRYAKYGDFLMRSQLDCAHDSLPGTGIFDLKTRAIFPIRHDVYNYQAYINHTIDALTGRWGTFEQEYYDMIRAAFLEYSFQARIGNMDGVFVAYHNTARIFGFQYISLREMDLCLFGRVGAGEHVFLRCVHLMQLLYEEIAKCFPEKSVKCTFEKRGHALRTWVEPVEWDSSDGSEPPVVELELSVKSIMRGQVVKGTYAVQTDKPWSIQYSITRIDADQNAIILRRKRAYARQMSIASFATSPGLEPTAEIEDINELLSVDAIADDAASQRSQDSVEQTSVSS